MSKNEKVERRDRAEVDANTPRIAPRESRSRLALALAASIIAFVVIALAPSVNAAIVCDIGFEEVSFDYANSTNIVGDGTNQGDAVLFSGVATRTCGGVPTTIDALVTTAALVDASVVHYEVNTASAGPDTSADTTTNFFEIDITALRTGGHADLTFSFFKGGTYPSAPEPVTLLNVKATAIDIDNKTYGILNSLDSFTLASDTRLSNDYAGGGFPANVKFTGQPSNGTNEARDRVTASYSSIQSFTYRIGVGDKDSNGQTLYFGLSFQDLGWQDPITTGDEYTISYNANGGTGTAPTSQTAVVGSAITIASNSGVPPLAKTGFVFTGWNTQADGLGTSYAPAANTFMPGSNVTLYAVWVPVDYTLSYDLNGAAGTPPTSQTVAYNTTTIVTSSVPTRTGYGFTGWNTAADGSGTSYASGATTAAITANVTLYAIWSTNDYTLSYDLNGAAGTPPTSQTVAYNTTTIVTSSVPTRTGYGFAGWNTQADGSGTSYASGATTAPITANVTLYAIWTPDEVTTTTTSTTVPESTTTTAPTPTPVTYWTVSFDPNGATSGSLPPSSLIFDTGLYNIPGNQGSLARSDGAEFLGWNTAANGSGILYSSGSKMAVTSNVVLYATWTPIAVVTLPTTAPEPALQVIIPTSPNPEDFQVAFPDRLPKTGIDLTLEVIAALLIGLTALAFVFEAQIRSLIGHQRRPRKPQH
jgi:uncharacterized repeat protein (TIGR02543 family)